MDSPTESFFLNSLQLLSIPHAKDLSETAELRLCNVMHIAFTAMFLTELQSMYNTMARDP